MAEENPPASPEERQQLLDALKAGKVDFSDAGKRYFERGGTLSFGSNADSTVVEATVDSCWGPWEKTRKDGTVVGGKGGIGISWSTVSAGFGMLTIYLDNDGKVKADTEGMSKDFCKAVLAKLIDSLDVTG